MPLPTLASQYTCTASWQCLEFPGLGAIAQRNVESGKLEWRIRDMIMSIGLPSRIKGLAVLSRIRVKQTWVL